MDALNAHQRKLMDWLLTKPQGGTLDELAALLGVTRTACKQQVLRLLDLGYLSFEDSKGEVGRPKRRYLVSPQGMDVFPKQYSWLSNALLGHLAAKLGPGGSQRLMKDLAASVAAPLMATWEKGEPVAQRLKRVVGLMNVLGYRAALKPAPASKDAVIEAVNCVYHSVAKEHPQLCQFDVSLLENASGSSVKLESCIAKGGAVCRFCLSRKGPATR